MLYQSKNVTGGDGAPSPARAGTEMVAIFSYTFNAAFTAATDLLELGILPATARVTGATLIGEGLGAITADVGLMTGDAGEYDETRTSGDELFDAESVNSTEADATTLTCLSIAKSDKHRGIGVELSGNVAAGASKKITLVLRYVY